MPRPVKRRCICSLPSVTRFAPDDAPAEGCVQIGYDEYEVLRLMDFVQMSQAQCAERMGVSRATVARMYERARRATVEALVMGRRLKIEGGDVTICLKPKPECVNEPYCCHRRSAQPPENLETASISREEEQ